MISTKGRYSIRILLVQVFQSLGTYLAKKCDKRLK